MDFAFQQGTLARLLGGDGTVLRAVEDVSLRIGRGEAYGLLGESGCGKSTLGRLLLRLLEPTAGRVRFDGQDITHASEAAMRPLRRRMQVVFQDPHASLNPAMTIGEAVMDPLRVHGLHAGGERERAIAALEEVGLAPAADLLDRRPADLSGGQKQRVCLARAMVLEPEFLVLDEPVSMLDMSVRAKVLELLQDLRRKHGLTMLFITHDLATARFLCDRVGVMYLGQLVEEGPAEAVFADPLHPYTRALLDALPVPDPTRRGLARPLRGEVPDAAHPPAGCRFHPRCPLSEARCGFGPADLREAWELAQGEPPQWEETHQAVRIPGASADAVRRVAQAGAPGLMAAMSVEQDPMGATARFPPAEPIGERVLGARRVRCLLHGDALHRAHEP